MKYLFYIVIILCFFSGFSGLGNEYESVEPELGIPLFLKIVTYDDSFDKAKYDGLMVYIIYDKANTRSYEQIVACRKYFKDHSNMKVAGLDIILKEVTVENINDFKTDIEKNKYNLLIFTDNLKEVLVDITEICQKENVHSFSFHPDYVDAGISVSIRPLAKKHKIIINLKSAKAEGSSFSTHLLKMCEII